MFNLSIIGAKNGSNVISISQQISLYEMRDKAKEFRERYSTLTKKETKMDLYLIYTLLQFCNDHLSGFDIKQARILRI